jgi:tetratricopeptide (TPR) repeat protein
MTQETRLAALLARENRFSDLYVIARSQLGLFLKTQGNYPAAFENFRVVKRIKKIPQQLRGTNLSEAASTKARMARTEEDKDVVKKLFDEAESLIDKSTLDDFAFLFHFDNNKYRYDRGSALIRSPLKELRDPETALSYLPALYRADAVSEENFQIVGHRQVSNHILQAEIALEQGDYPTAISLAEEALNYSEQLQSKAHLKKVLRIYQALKQSLYCNDDKVIMLEIRLVRNLYPERFSKDYEV